MLDLSTFDFILTPYSYHDSFLKHKSPQLKDSFLLLTKEQWLEELVIDIDENLALPYLMLHHDLSLNMAKTVIRSLNFIPSPSPNSTLQHLYDTYQRFMTLGAIKKHTISHLKYKQKRIGVYGYHKEDPQLQSLFSQLDIKPTWLSLPVYSSLYPVIAYSSLEEEVTAFYNQVATLLKIGVDINNILLLTPSPDYHLPLIRQSHYFKIPIHLEVEPSFFSYPIAQAFLSSLPFDSLLEDVYVSLHTFPEDQLIFLKRLVEKTPKDIFESFIFKSYIKDVFLSSYLPSEKYVNALRVVDACITLPHEHLFILGFNQGSFPKIIKDNRYLSDTVRVELGQPTTALENALSFSLIEAMIQQSNQIYISFRKLALNKEMLPSSLVHTLHLKVIHAEEALQTVDYSQSLGLFSYTSKLEALTRYHTIDPLLEAYKQQYLPKMPLPYDPSFKGLPELSKDTPLSLSYSSINNFYQCQFKYYLSSVLKLEVKQNPYYMNLGRLTHQIFERIVDDLSDFDSIFTEVLQALFPLTSKEKTLFSNLKPTIYNVIEFNLLHKKRMNLSKIEAERSFEITLDTYTKLKGTIDKVVVTQNDSNKTYASLIDYKSGVESFKPNHVQFGLSLQLPIYALLMERHLAYEGIEVIGIYIQHIMNTDLSVKNMDIDGQPFRASLKLDGIFVDDHQALKTFDPSLHSDGTSLFVQALKVKADGTLGGGKRLYTKEAMKDLSTQAHHHLMHASTEIRHQAFTINPKQVAKDLVCKQCPFHDICYRRQQDIIHLNPKVNTGQGDNTDESE